MNWVIWRESMNGKFCVATTKIEWRDSMKMWVARNSDNTLELFKIKPKSFYEEGSGQYWAGGNGLFLRADSFPEVTFENSPMEVELKLIVK